MPRDYRSLLAALERLDSLSAGPARDRAVAELRADLKALSAAAARCLVMDVQRAADARWAVLARRARPPRQRASV